MWNSLRDLSPTGLHTERCVCVCVGGTRIYTVGQQYTIKVKNTTSTWHDWA